MKILSALVLWALIALVIAPPTTDPPWENDAFPPYPSTTDVTTKSRLGTRLYGWEGCFASEKAAIAEAYDDFYTLAQQDGVAKNIDWKSPAAVDFWGPSKENNKVSDTRRAEIQQIFNATQQVYAFWWGIRPSLWIHVKCSGGDGKGDPGNVCGDEPNPPQPHNCPSGQVPAAPRSPAHPIRLQAFSDPHIDDWQYSAITFCSAFFSLNNLATAVKLGKALKKPTERDNLNSYDNRARVFFHEVTHLDYFMNTPAKGPPTDDVQIKVDEDGIISKTSSYGAFYTKVLTNYKRSGKGGFYTQRNSDSYAFFALVKYVTGKLGHYPYNPKTNLQPIDAPRSSRDESFNFTDSQAQQEADAASNAAEGLVTKLPVPFPEDVDDLGDPLNNGTFD